MWLSEASLALDRLENRVTLQQNSKHHSGQGGNFGGTVVSSLECSSVLRHVLKSHDVIILLKLSQFWLVSVLMGIWEFCAHCGASWWKKKQDINVQNQIWNESLFSGTSWHFAFLLDKKLHSSSQMLSATSMCLKWRQRIICLKILSQSTSYLPALLGVNELVDVHGIDTCKQQRELQREWFNFLSLPLPSHCLHYHFLCPLYISEDVMVKLLSPSIAYSHTWLFSVFFLVYVLGRKCVCWETFHCYGNVPWSHGQPP